MGPLTESDLITASGNRYYRSESIGKAGLEFQYDSFLRGKPGVRTVIVDRKESVMRQSQNTKSVPGDHVVTSLDVRLQAATENALADAVARARVGGYRADSGAAIVMDVKTGRVLSIASYPTYDPNIWEKGLTVQQAKDLFSDAKGVPALSRALQGQYAPASTFKIVSLVAAANAGYNLKATYSCPASVTVGNLDFQNFESKSQGTITMKMPLQFRATPFGTKSPMTNGYVMVGYRQSRTLNDYFSRQRVDFRLRKKLGLICLLKQVDDCQIVNGVQIGTTRIRIISAIIKPGRRKSVDSISYRTSQGKLY